MSYKLVKRIKAIGWPISSKKWRGAHQAANKAEKKKYGKQYKALKKIAKKLPKGELLGSHTKSGKIKVSAKVPKRLRKSVAYHELIEHRLMTKGKSKKIHAKKPKSKR